MPIVNLLCSILMAMIFLFGLSCSKQPPNPASLDWSVVPRGGVGPVKFGMTKAEVRKVLGKPTFEQAEILDYTELGMSVIYKTDGRTIGSINCGSIDGNSEMILAFKGLPFKGLRLGSSREELVKALGPPGKTFQEPEKLRYDDLAADFIIRDGKVAYMVFRPGK